MNFALRQVAAEPFFVDEAHTMRGDGWEGDLEELRPEYSAEGGVTPGPQPCEVVVDVMVVDVMVDGASFRITSMSANRSSRERASTSSPGS